jgi:hypothetical protein
MTNENLSLAVDKVIGDLLRSMGKDDATIALSCNLFVGLMREFPQLPTYEEISEGGRMLYYWRRIITDNQVARSTLNVTVATLRDAGLLQFLPGNPSGGIVRP